MLELCDIRITPSKFIFLVFVLLLLMLLVVTLNFPSGIYFRNSAIACVCAWLGKSIKSANLKGD